MKGSFILTLLLLFLIAPAASAKLTVQCDLKKVSQHELLVTLEWDATIHSDKAWGACDLIITFHDKEGNEIYRIKEDLQLKVGSNSFSGMEICSTEIWKLTGKFKATVDCIL